MITIENTAKKCFTALPLRVVVCRVAGLPVVSLRSTTGHFPKSLRDENCASSDCCNPQDLAVQGSLYQTSFLAEAPRQLAWHEPKFCQLEYDAKQLASPHSQPLAAKGGERMGTWGFKGIKRSNFKTHSPMRQAHGVLEKDVRDKVFPAADAAGQAMRPC